MAEPRLGRLCVRSGKLPSPGSPRLGLRNTGSIWPASLTRPSPGRSWARLNGLDSIAAGLSNCSVRPLTRWAGPVRSRLGRAPMTLLVPMAE